MEGHEEDGGGAEEAVIMIQHWTNFCFFSLRDGPFLDASQPLPDYNYRYPVFLYVCLSPDSFGHCFFFHRSCCAMRPERERGVMIILWTKSGEVKKDWVAVYCGISSNCPG